MITHVTTILWSVVVLCVSYLRLVKYHQFQQVPVWLAEFWLRIALLCFVFSNTSTVDIMIISSTTWIVGLLNLAVSVIDDVNAKNSCVDEKITNVVNNKNLSKTAHPHRGQGHSLWPPDWFGSHPSPSLVTSATPTFSSCELVSGCKSQENPDNSWYKWWKKSQTTTWDV